MQLRLGSAVFATALFALAAAAPAAMAAREPLNAYRVAPTAENKQKLALAGYDMVEADHGGYLEVYGTAKQAAERSRATGSRRSSSARPTRSPRRPPTSRRQRRPVQRLAPLRPRPEATPRSSTSSSMTGSRA